MLLYFSSSWAALPRWRVSCRFPGCPPRFWPLGPPRPRRRPPCRLLIKCLRPYAVSMSPVGLRRTGPHQKRLLTLSFRSAHKKREVNGRLRRGLGRDALSCFRGGAGPAQDPDVVWADRNAKRFSITSRLRPAHGGD